jgi:hypothetical protein
MFTNSYIVVPVIVVLGVVWVVLMFGAVAVELRAMFPGARPRPWRASSRRRSRELPVVGGRVAAAPPHPAPGAAR